MSWELTITSSSNEKINSLYIKGYSTPKHSLLAEVTVKAAC